MVTSGPNQRGQLQNSLRCSSRGSLTLPPEFLWALEEVTGICKRIFNVLQDNWDDEEEEEEVKETEVKQGEVFR